MKEHIVIGNKVFKFVEGGGCACCSIRNEVSNCHDVVSSNCSGGRWRLCIKKKPLTNKKNNAKRKIRYHSKFVKVKTRVRILYTPLYNRSGPVNV